MRYRVVIGTIQTVMHQPPKPSGPRRRHTARPLSRRIAGWALIGLALLGMALPVMPGLIFLALAIVLLGPHDPLLRRAGYIIRLLLRRLSQARHRRLRLLGRAARWRYADARKQVREVLHHHERGEISWRAHLPLLATMLLGLTASAAIGLAVAHTIP